MTDEHDRTLTRLGRKASVGAAGVTTVAVGVALIPLPGPGTFIILGGLTILGQEFPAAQRLADRGWGQLSRVLKRFRRTSLK